MDSIHGVSLEKYAELCALMANTAGNEAKEFAIAAEHGIQADNWKAAKTGWTSKFSDPADMGKTAMAFLPLFQAAQEKLRGGDPPCTLELFGKIHAQIAFMSQKQGTNSEKSAFSAVLEKNGLTPAQWNEYNSYWTFKVTKDHDGNTQYDPALSLQFNQIIAAESGRIMKEQQPDDPTDFGNGEK